MPPFLFDDPIFTQQNQTASFRLVAFDLDHTVLKNDGTLSSVTLSALKMLNEKQIHIVIASGRPYSSLPKELLDFPGIDYAITSNGAALIRLHPLEYIDQIFLPTEEVRSLVSSFGDKYPLEVFINGQGYANQEYVESPSLFGAKERQAAYIQATRIPVKNMTGFIVEHQSEIESLDILVPTIQTNQNLRQQLCPEYPNLHITSSNDHMIEISHGKAGKGNRLAHLLQLLHISPAECVAFGDGDNDADMLQMAGLGIAMENASVAAKKAASYLTYSNEEDGVAAILNYLKWN